MADLQIVTQNVVNLYTEPDTSSALASQAILGERVSAGEEQNGFVRVTTEDGYQSWMKAGPLLPDAGIERYFTTIAALFAEVYTRPDVRSEIWTKLSVGSRVFPARRANIGDWVPVDLPGGYIHSVNLSQTHESLEISSADNLKLAQESGLRRSDIVSALGINITETAKRLIGTPYLWGGTTPFGMDCSGLTQLAYKLNGIQLLRDASMQFADGRFVQVEEGQSLETAILDAGDLVAFSRRPDKRPTHIGLALGDGRFLHSRGGLGVRIDFCDSEDYSASYLGAVRLSADADFGVQNA